MQNSFYPRRSGDVILNLMPGWIEEQERCWSMSGSMYGYDTEVPLVFYGKGAGKLPTASAVVGDVIDCARHENKQKFFGWADSEEGYVADYLDMPTALYVRGRAQQKQQVISSAEKAFGEIKLLKRAGAPEDEFAFVTPAASERALRTQLETLLGAEIISTIRVTDY